MPDIYLILLGILEWLCAMADRDLLYFILFKICEAQTYTDAHKIPNYVNLPHIHPSSRVTRGPPYYLRCQRQHLVGEWDLSFGL